MSHWIHDQPPPAPAAGDVWNLILEDMKDRRRVGIERYGTPLQPFNGRDALADAYAEALDLAVYLRQAIAERADASAADRLLARVAELEDRLLRLDLDLNRLAGGVREALDPRNQWLLDLARERDEARGRLEALEAELARLRSAGGVCHGCGEAVPCPCPKED